MIFESLTGREQLHVAEALAGLMGIETPAGQSGGAGSPAWFEQVLQGTLVRRIEPACFSVDSVASSCTGTLQATEQHPAVLHIATRDLPNPLPFGWTLRAERRGVCEVEVWKNQETQLQRFRAMPVQSAGQLPEGFDPGSFYRSTHHPRGLQLSVMAATDAVHSIGIPWRSIVSQLSPDEVAVYSSSVMSQLDRLGLGGVLQARMRGERVSSKQLALGLNTMPADFVNAYVLGNMGATGGVTGACATFLYNLRAGVEDIKAGRCRVAVVGSSEAPILPEVIDGYAAMSALATDADLRKLDGSEQVNHRRASRPFGLNCGFTLAESGQYVVLMDDALALELGANIYGAVPGVFINADGFKTSISAPGPGNYLTMLKAVALAQTLLGADTVRQRSFIQAHGSSTPQNRVTESRIFDQVARAYGVEHWPVAAVKAYLGHSLGPASGDQMVATLGVFAHGILPGIKTITEVAGDVHAERLQIRNHDQDLGRANCQVGFLNSKGFGGNNASATVFSPEIMETLLIKRHGQRQWTAYLKRRERTLLQAESYEQAAARGHLQALYQFGEGMVDEADMTLEGDELRVPNYAGSISLNNTEGFDDFLDE